MNYKITKHLFLLSIFAVLLTSCIEEIDFEAETFESALVIEATITNEYKNQEILLSRTFQFEEIGPNPESNAIVTVETENTIFSFNEIEPGRYVSLNEFEAINDVAYTLKIVTNTGRSYVSSPTYLTQTSQIDNVYAIRETNDNGENGMSVYVDSFDPSGNSKYYRYDYTETFKIVAPYWSSEDVIVVENNAPICIVDVVPRTQEEKTCYGTVKSNTFNLLNTNNLAEDRVSRHLVRFINSQDYILTYRYSILVRQFIQSREAYNYYKTLKDFSEEGSLFSQNQPGFYSGNVVSETNTLEKVIGFFDVATVSSQRIFFNYEDFYPDENIPPYAQPCTLYAPALINRNGSCGNLIWDTLNNSIKYYTENNGQYMGGPKVMVSRPCGDCTALGSNVVPDFWID